MGRVPGQRRRPRTAARPRWPTARPGVRARAASCRASTRSACCCCWPTARCRPATAPDWVGEWLASRSRPARRSRPRAPPGPRPAGPAAPRGEPGQEGRRRRRRAAPVAGRPGPRRAGRRAGAAVAVVGPDGPPHDRRAGARPGEPGTAAAEIAAAGGQRPDWPERMLDEVGGLYLLCEAWTRRENLPPEPPRRCGPGSATRGHGRGAAGRTADHRQLGGARPASGRRRPAQTLQQWLYGERSGEVVTYLAFAVAASPWSRGCRPVRGPRRPSCCTRVPARTGC